jgi:hypothetical protein
MPKIDTLLAIREAEYGDALENFEKIGRIWGALLDIDDIEPYKVALLMDALKTVRLFANGQHEDSWLDKHGYIKHAQDIANQ